MRFKPKIFRLKKCYSTVSPSQWDQNCSFLDLWVNGKSTPEQFLNMVLLIGYKWNWSVSHKKKFKEKRKKKKEKMVQHTMPTYDLKWLLCFEYKVFILYYLLSIIIFLILILLSVTGIIWNARLFYLFHKIAYFSPNPKNNI